MVKKIFWSFLFIYAFSVLGEEPVLTDVPLVKAFIPIGFDDNDVTQVVVVGIFPDTCYKLGPSHFELKNHQIKITQRAYRYPGICLRMLVPFSNVVDLGVLHAKNYELFSGVTQAKLGALPVVRAKSASADEFLYAPVYEAEIIGLGTPEPPKLRIKGTFTNRCSRLKETKLSYYEDVVVVQPIMEVTSQEESMLGCNAEKVRFQEEIALNKSFESTTLFHIRVMSGQAINKLVLFP